MHLLRAILPVFLILFIFNTGQAQQKKKNPAAYKIFNAQGKEVNYKKMVDALKDVDMVFFGELHNNPICHWLQLEVTRELYAQRGDELVLGAEMFEVDNQLILNEYIMGYIAERNYKSEMRLWPNYATDYAPLVELARENGLRFAATNVPRRYAAMVAKEGIDKLEDLPEHSQYYFAPLPISVDMTVPCYEKMLEMSNGNEFFPQAQMLKDATMAHFILTNWAEGELFLHYNGAFHSDYGQGIIHYLKEKNPDLNIMVISTVEQDTIKKLYTDNEEKGDFIICIPSRMTKTY